MRNLLFVVSIFMVSSLFMAQDSFADADSISGVVSISKDLEKGLTPTGVLFIVARAAGDTKPGMPPLAVLRIPQPKFPQSFTIGSKNSMMGGKFEGEMLVLARYSASGDALDKAGPQGTDPKNQKAKPGKSDLKIELLAQKKK